MGAKQRTISLSLAPTVMVPMKTDGQNAAKRKSYTGSRSRMTDYKKRRVAAETQMKTQAKAVKNARSRERYAQRKQSTGNIYIST